jgi:hypothetical protein
MNDADRLRSQGRTADMSDNQFGPYEWRVFRAYRWRLITDDRSRTCRRRSCDEPAVAELQRGSTRLQWWAYCGDHMYGRWLEDGEVVEYRLRGIGEPHQRDQIRRVTT